MPRVIFQVSDREKALMVEAAHRELVTLSEWLRRAAEVRLGGLEAGVAQNHERPGTKTATGAHPSPGTSPVDAESMSEPPPASNPSKKCSREARHHINHSGKPCPECGFPK